MARDKGWSFTRPSTEGEIAASATAIARTRLAGGTSKPSLPKLTYRGQGQQPPSKPDSGPGVGAAKPSQQYTGSAMLGVATLHKSNAVPVFSSDAAKDISKMRR